MIAPQSVCYRFNLGITNRCYDLVKNDDLHVRTGESSEMSHKANARRKGIKALIEKQGKIGADELARRYEISIETVRRDLRTLEAEGAIKRSYGIAEKVEPFTNYLPYTERLTHNQALKEAIAQAAVERLKPGDAIFIDGKTTGLAFARNIPREMELSIATNSAFAVSQLTRMLSRAQIYLIGGEVDKDGLTSGPKFYQELRNYWFQKVFFSVAALNRQGCFFVKPDSALLVQQLSEVGEEMVLLADSSKLERKAFVYGLELSKIDCLITDWEAPSAFVEDVRRMGCNVVIANKQ
ncbi:DeoR/GlpR family DNA-binding transcription regulator [Paenibacillus sp. TRM 82003]|nr:DeoR/GlpR family DNA-binding transcription regulator [Paenibacillus sp. TRM 82003]